MRRVLLAVALLACCGGEGEAEGPTTTGPTASQLIIDGQSLALSPEQGVGLPRFVQSLLPVEWYPDVDVVARNATSYADRSGDAPHRVDDLVDPSRRSVLVDVAGQSELWRAAGALSAKELLEVVEAYAADRRAAGVDVYVVATVPPVSTASPSSEAERVAYNELLHASDAFDAVVDLAAIPEARDPLDRDWYSDGAHPTAALAALFAVEIVHALDVQLGLPVR